MTKEAFARLLFSYSEMALVDGGRHFNVTDPSGNEHWFSLSHDDVSVEAPDGDVEDLLRNEICAWDTDQAGREGWNFEEIFLE